MAKYATLKAAIEEIITTNGNYEISGEDMRETLKAIVDSLGADYQLVGFALPATDPGTPDQNVAYLAGPGTYPNFGPTTVKPGEIGIFKYNGTWDVKVIQTDTTTNVININAIANHPAGYATPALALADVPERYRKLGCTVVFKDDTTEEWVMMIYKDDFGGDDAWTDIDNNWRTIGPVYLRQSGIGDGNYILQIGLNTDFRIINNFDSDTPYHVLSAKQGRLLNEKIEGWTQELESIDTTGVQLPRPLLQGMIITKIEGATKLILVGQYEEAITPADLPYKIQHNAFSVKTESGTATDVTIGVRGVLSDDFINVNDYYGHSAAYASAQAARADVALTERKKGLCITYLLADGWHIEQFKGDDIADWGVTDNWDIIIDKKPIITSSVFNKTLSNYCIGESKQRISSEVGGLLRDGTVDSTYTEWTINKYDVSTDDIVFVTGRSTAISCLAATYDDNDNLIDIFVLPNVSTNYDNVLIPVNNAAYIKVAGHNTQHVADCRKFVVPSSLTGKMLIPISSEVGAFLRDGTIDSQYTDWTVNKYSVGDNEILLVSGRSTSQTCLAATYDNNDNLISTFILPLSSINYDNIPINVKGATYIKIAGYHSNYYNIHQPAICKELAYKQKNILYNKKVVFLGDSMTEGGQGTGAEQVTADKVYHRIFADLTGCINVNLGVAGTCIANNTLNGMSNQRFVTRATSANLSDADYIVVWGGSNDFTYDSKAIGALFDEQTITPTGYIGNKRKVAITDTDTFAGALHNLIETIRTHNATAPILFITPLNRTNYNAGRPSSHENNQWGDWFSDFGNAIKEICAFYSIPVFDIGSFSNLDPNNPTINSVYFVDGIHPNASGHKIIGTLLYHWFKANMMFE